MNKHTTDYFVDEIVIDSENEESDKSAGPRAVGIMMIAVLIGYPVIFTLWFF